MPGDLFDTSVWLAVLLRQHVSNSAAEKVLVRSVPVAPALLCRATQQSVLRLITTPTIQNAYGTQGLTNRGALAVLDALQALPNVKVVDEPVGTVALWRRLAGLPTASPKVWMDAYLAAFAIAGGFRMVTLDADFRTYLPSGLNLDLIR